MNGKLFSSSIDYVMKQTKYVWYKFPTPWEGRFLYYCAKTGFIAIETDKGVVAVKCESFAEQSAYYDEQDGNANTNGLHVELPDNQRCWLEGPNHTLAEYGFYATPEDQDASLGWWDVLATPGERIEVDGTQLPITL